MAVMRRPSRGERRALTRNGRLFASWDYRSPVQDFGPLAGDGADHKSFAYVPVQGQVVGDLATVLMLLIWFAVAAIKRRILLPLAPHKPGRFLTSSAIQAAYSVWLRLGYSQLTRLNDTGYRVAACVGCDQ